MRAAIAIVLLLATAALGESDPLPIDEKEYTLGDVEIKLPKLNTYAHRAGHA